MPFRVLIFFLLPVCFVKSPNPSSLLQVGMMKQPIQSCWCMVCIVGRGKDDGLIVTIPSLGVFGSGKRYIRNHNQANLAGIILTSDYYSYLAAVIIIFLRDIIDTACLHREPDDLITFRILVSSNTVSTAPF